MFRKLPSKTIHTVMRNMMLLSWANRWLYQTRDRTSYTQLRSKTRSAVIYSIILPLRTRSRLGKVKLKSHNLVTNRILDRWKFRRSRTIHLTLVQVWKAPITEIKWWNQTLKWDKKCKLTVSKGKLLLELFI